MNTAVIDRPSRLAIFAPEDSGNVATLPAAPADGSLVISQLTPHLRSAWNDFVCESPTASFFHDLEWMEAVREVYGHTPRYLTAYSSDTCRVRGVLPLFEVYGPLTGHALISVPYGVYGGADADCEGVRDELLSAARRLADKLNVSYLEVRQGTPASGFANRCHYFTFRKRMPDSAGAVLDSFPGKARNKIRGGIKTHGLTAAFGRELLDDFYKLYVISLRRLASPPHKRLFFERLCERFADRCQVHLIYYKTTPVAGALALVHRDCIAPYFVGLDRAFSRLNTSNYLYYHLMTHGIESGLRVFDLGRTRQDNTGGCDFKMNQGFQPEPLHYGYYSPRGVPAPDLRHSNPRFALAKAVWSKLPCQCVSSLGGFVTCWLP
ncbi:MAG TPA: FemAB family XrtA/PEP-CTERM system-associated protein [Planctomycetaceae bacterium]